MNVTNALSFHAQSFNHGFLDAQEIKQLSDKYLEKTIEESDRTLDFKVVFMGFLCGHLWFSVSFSDISKNTHCPGSR